MGDEVRVAFEEGRRAWPKVASLDLERFARHVEEAGVEAQGLSQHASDLFLAAAAAAGDGEAAVALNQQVLSQIGKWLSPFRMASDAMDEIRQQLFSKLVVGPPPRLASYRGNGPLGAWVRVAAVRLALDVCGAPEGATRPSLPSDASPLDSPTPEEEIARRAFAPRLQVILKEAIANLPPRERTILRFHYMSRMSIDDIAKIYQVHRATAARWLTNIRDDLEGAVTDRMCQEASISPVELRSLWRVVRSDMDVSLSRLLGPADGPAVLP